EAERWKPVGVLDGVGHEIRAEDDLADAVDQPAADLAVLKPGVDRREQLGGGQKPWVPGQADRGVDTGPADLRVGVSVVGIEPGLRNDAESLRLLVPPGD